MQSGFFELQNNSFLIFKRYFFELQNKRFLNFKRTGFGGSKEPVL